MHGHAPWFVHSNQIVIFKNNCFFNIDSHFVRHMGHFIRLGYPNRGDTNNIPRFNSIVWFSAAFINAHLPFSDDSVDQCARCAFNTRHEEIIEALPFIIGFHLFKYHFTLRIFSHIKPVVKKKRFDALAIFAIFSHSGTL